ncbi:MAG: ankyrin repeat domain-containing protein [Cyanobacteria bacterium P01_A01_bin.116]
MLKALAVRWNLAAKGGNLEICEMLIEHGADVNQLGFGIFLPGTFNIPYSGNFP